jgi:hypothetical protein
MRWRRRQRPAKSTASIFPVAADSHPARGKCQRAGAAAANSPAVEAEIAAWFDATTLEEEKAAARRLNKAFLDYVVYAPVGWYLRHYAWRRSLTGVTQGPLPFFWGVSKTV